MTANLEAFLTTSVAGGVAGGNSPASAARWCSPRRRVLPGHPRLPGPAPPGGPVAGRLVLEGRAAPEAFAARLAELDDDILAVSASTSDPAGPRAKESAERADARHR